MKQLSYLDASFLYLEGDHAPMHVGGTFVFKDPASTPMTFARFAEHILSRLQTSPVFRRRLVEIPMDLDLPYWIEDPHFDIHEHLHIHHLSLGTKAELREKSQEFFSKPLDREKPLWEITFVDGLEEEGDFALMIKIHHCAIDGVSGEEILVGILDFSEQPRLLAEDTWESEDFPAYSVLVGRKLQKTASTSKKLWGLIKNSTETANRSIRLRAQDKRDAPPRFFDSPSSPFNVQVEAQRNLAHANLPLTKIKEIKNSKEGLTVNDVALTICSAALEELLVRSSSLPKESLVAMAPVSKRGENGGASSAGNEVSAMLLSLETHCENLLARMDKIHDNSRKGIQYNRAVAAEQLLDFLPPMTSAVSTRVFSKFKLSQLLKPIFNVVITNVPGSPVPLYLDGAKLVSQSFNAPICDYAGLTMTVTSYMDVLTIGFTTTPGIVPNSEEFVGLILASFERLYGEACGTQKSASPTFSEDCVA
ncbi:hypothetical protein A9Q99_12230 [Gammaproteobacteria bacterium 45_16_T64]|nr:hypothetical protein A9Q99_12230 [Gammaproteobacteria bacterium 45_16_T64]